MYCTHIFLLFLSPSFVICTPQNIRANSSCLCPARQKKTSKKIKKRQTSNLKLILSSHARKKKQKRKRPANSSYLCPAMQQKNKKAKKKKRKEKSKLKLCPARQQKQIRHQIFSILLGDLFVFVVVAIFIFLLNWIFFKFPP